MSLFFLVVMSAASPRMWADAFAPLTALLTSRVLYPLFTLIGCPKTSRICCNLLAVSIMLQISVQVEGTLLSFCDVLIISLKEKLSGYL